MADVSSVNDYTHGSTGVLSSNGITVGYTVSNLGTVSNSDYGITDSARVGTGSGFSTQTSSTTVEFDQAVSGVDIGITSLQASNNGISVPADVRIYVDGVQQDLNDLIASGDAIFDDNASGAYITDGGDISSTVNHHDSWGSGQANYRVATLTLTLPVNSVTVEQFSTAADLNTFDIGLTDAVAFAPCFTAGTLIETQNGPIPVETLQAGDLIRTKDHGFQPVKWVGGSRIYATGFDVPLRIKAGTFNNTRDLVVSKRHKMLMNHTHLSLMFDVEEAFACAMHLRNDDTITREPEGWVTYYHILLPQHEVIFAEGAATESFYPDEGTLAGMAAKTKEELLTHFAPTTYGPPARLTLDPTRAMWIGRNLDILQGDDIGQIAAYENAMKVAE